MYTINTYTFIWIEAKFEKFYVYLHNICIGMNYSFTIFFILLLFCKDSIRNNNLESAFLMILYDFYIKDILKIQIEIKNYINLPQIFKYRLIYLPKVYLVIF